MTFSRAPVGRRLGVVIFFRVLLATLAWGAFYLTQAGTSALPPTATVAVLWVLGAAGLVNVPYLLLPRRMWRCPAFLHFQVVFDILLVSALVYLTGGARSLFVPFYFAAILSACFFLSEGVAVGYAAFVAILLSGVTVAYTVGGREGLPYLPPEWLATRGGPAPYGYLLLQGVSSFIIAFLGGRLAAGLRRAEHLNEVILANLTDGVVAVNRAGVVTFVNPEARRLLGLAPEEPCEGAPAQSFLAPEEGADLETVLATGGTRRRASRRAWPDGRACDYEIRTSPLRGPRGRVTGALIVLADLAVRKRMEEALRRAERLESSAELAAGIAHEIRNPLASVRACAQELAKVARPADPDEARMLDLIVRESDHVNRIVSGAIDFARPLRPWIRPVDLAALVAETVEVARLRFSEIPGDWRITIDIAPGADLMADPDLLRQVFINLIHNAFQAMEFGGGTLAIEAAPSADGRGEPGVRIAFSDSGPGLSEAAMASLFKPFYTTKVGGTGLGLAVSHRIVQAHGGEMRVESSPGGGARFVIWLPARPAAPEGSGAPGGSRP